MICQRNANSEIFKFFLLTRILCRLASIQKSFSNGWRSVMPATAKYWLVNRMPSGGKPAAVPGTALKSVRASKKLELALRSYVNPDGKRPESPGPKKSVPNSYGKSTPDFLGSNDPG